MIDAEELTDEERRWQTVERRNFQNCPRFNEPYRMSEEQMDHLSIKIQEKVTALQRDELYKNVGRAIVGKMFWLAGFIVVGTALWLNKLGIITIKLP